MKMSRVALFISMMLAGVLLFETVGLLVRNEVWLVAGVIAAVLLFCIPQSGQARDPKDLIFSLASVIAIYFIWLKFRPWLADLTGGVLATVMSVLMVFAVGGFLLLLLAPKRAETQTDNAR